MSDIHDWEENERLRQDDRDARSRVSRINRADPGGSPTVLAKTKTLTTYPATAGKFFACETLKLLGTETEGSPGSVTGISDTFFAYLPAGAPVPASGDEVVCRWVAHRWVIEL